MQHFSISETKCMEFRISNRSQMKVGKRVIWRASPSLQSHEVFRFQCSYIREREKWKYRSKLTFFLSDMVRPNQIRLALPTWPKFIFQLLLLFISIFYSCYTYTTVPTARSETEIFTSVLVNNLGLFIHHLSDFNTSLRLSNHWR